MPPIRAIKSPEKLASFFESSRDKVFSQSGLTRALRQQRAAIGAGDLQEVIDSLVQQGQVTRAVLKSEEYGREMIRFAWGPPSIYAIAASLSGTAYLSHGTAVFLHGLTDLIPKVLYVNIEQSPKTAPKGSLTQEAIARAFSRQQRQSNLHYKWEQWTITVVNGKYSEQLGVEQMQDPLGQFVPVTNLERTLVDVVVRPAYAGGIFNVFQAYRAAKEEMSTNRLMATLKKLDHAYPYHQAIGFLMQRAGYDSSRYGMLKELGIHYDFYLTHGVTDPEYDAEWRLFFPRGLES